MLKYKRVLIKISGEALAGERGFGIDYETVVGISKAIKEASDSGAEIAVVVGGGNFWRGAENSEMERSRADHMGMLGTLINALALTDALEQLGATVRVQTALAMQQVAELYIRNRAIRHLEKGRVVINACGTGNPYFSTDTAAALRAAEIGADIILKATQVDGVYDKDPNRFPDAVRIPKLSFTRVLSEKLMVVDSTAASMCRDNNIPMQVFDLNDPYNIVRAVLGEDIGTIITEEA